MVANPSGATGPRPFQICPDPGFGVTVPPKRAAQNYDADTHDITSRYGIRESKEETGRTKETQSSFNSQLNHLRSLSVVAQYESQHGLGIIEACVHVGQ